jgi:hypothetical protein
MHRSEAKYIQNYCKKNYKKNNYSEDLGTHGRVWTGNVVHITVVMNFQTPYHNYSEDLGTHGRVWTGNVVHITVVMNFQTPYHLESIWTS